MHLKFVLVILVMVAIIPAIYFIMSVNNEPNNTVESNSEKLDESFVSENQLQLSAITISDDVLQPVLDEYNVIGFGYLWFVHSTSSNPSEGILTNIHSQDGNVLDYWHNELVLTNYDQANSFCIISQKVVGSVDVTRDTITVNISLDEITGKISEKYFTVKIVSDTQCHSGISAVISDLV